MTALAEINFGGIKDRLGGPLLKKKCFEAGPDLLSSFEYTAATLNLKQQNVFKSIQNLLEVNLKLISNKYKNYFEQNIRQI